MTAERATIRPVTLSRLVELVHACQRTPQSTENLEETLGVTHRRARETILEALRIGFIDESRENTYTPTAVGTEFLTAVLNEEWTTVSRILAAHSPHYRALLSALGTCGPMDGSELLDDLVQSATTTPYAYNQTVVEVVGDWAERLRAVQRNAFTGEYYCVEHDEMSEDFPAVLLDVYDEIEETAGVDLRQRYLSIPRLREHTCQRIGCPRDGFNDALLSLSQQNIGKIELSGAPLDTVAKDSVLGIKRIELADEGSIVSTSQSTDRVMDGVELFDKQYYYAAIYDRNLKFTPENQ